MRWAAGILVAAATLLLTLGSCEERRLAESEVLAALDTLEQRLDWIEYRCELEAWRYSVEGVDDSLAYFRDVRRSLLRDDRWLEPLRFGAGLISDDVNRRRLQLLSREVLLGRIEAEAAIADLCDSLLGMHLGYQAQFEGQPCDIACLMAICENDPRRVRRETAYRAVQKLGTDAAQGVAALFRMRNQEARRLGYNDFGNMVFKLGSPDERAYADYLAEIDSLTRPAYLELLDRARREQRVDRLELWDLTQWGSDARQLVDPFFPAESLLVIAQRSFAAMDFDLKRLPIFVETAHEGVSSAPSKAFIMGPPSDQRVVVDGHGGIEAMRQMMYELGRAVSASFVAQASPAFNRFVAPEWGEAMAALFAGLCDDPLWLEKHALVPADTARRYAEARGDQETIAWRLLLLRARFEQKAYENPSVDLSQLYWTLFVDIMALPRHDDMKPWATVRSYVTQPLYTRSLVLAELITAQTLQFIRQRHERFADNPTAHSFLVQNYFRFGSRYDWPELLERGTGRALTVDSLLLN